MKYIIMSVLFSGTLHCIEPEDIARSRSDFVNCLSFFIKNNIDYKKFDTFEKLIVKNQDIYDEYITNYKGAIRDIK